MSQVLFYHLTEHRLERALPTLVERSLARGWRVVIQTSDAGRAAELSKLLWTVRADSFLANGHAGENAERAADQPIWITPDVDAPNGAQVRFLVDGAEPGDLSAYERAIFMFDGLEEEAVKQARVHWAAQTGRGKLTYWKQNEDGQWEIGLEA